MKISNTLNTLYANKHNLAFAICLSVVVMILFRSLTFSVVAVAFITSPHLILILKNDNQECLFSRTNIMSMSVLYYSLGSLVPLVIAMIPSYIVSLFLKDGTTLKIAMIIFLFRAIQFVCTLSIQNCHRQSRKKIHDIPVDFNGGYPWRDGIGYLCPSPTG